MTVASLPAQAVVHGEFRSYPVVVLKEERYHFVVHVAYRISHENSRAGGNVPFEKTLDGAQARSLLEIKSAFGVCRRAAVSFREGYLSAELEGVLAVQIGKVFDKLGIRIRPDDFGQFPPIRVKL